MSVFWLTLALMVASFGLNIGGIEKFPSATFYSIASRAWELLIGAMLAHLSLRKQAVLPGLDSAAARNTLSFVGLGLIILACALVRGGKGFPGWWALLPTLGAACLIGAGPQAWINRVVLSNRALLWVGLISYPLYLWHWPLLSFAQIVESGVPALEIRIAALLGALLLAWLTYALVERPIRLRGSRRPGVAIVLALLVAAIGAAGAWVYKKDGLPSRQSIVENASLQVALNVVEDRENAAACKKRYGFDTVWEYCLMGNAAKEPTIGMVGDSHAYHVSAGLLKYYGEQGENLVYFGTRVPYIGVKPAVNDDYQEATGQMLDLILAIPSIKKVIISTIVKHSETEEGKLLTEQFRTTLRALHDAGKEVIYFYDVPNLDFEPRACIRRAGIASSTTNRDCTMDAAAFGKAVEEHKRIIASVLKEFPTVTTFAPARYLCDERHCKGMIDQKLMYRDSHHLTYDGDLYIGARFAEEQKASAANRSWQATTGQQ